MRSGPCNQALTEMVLEVDSDDVDDCWSPFWLNCANKLCNEANVCCAEDRSPDWRSCPSWNISRLIWLDPLLLAPPTRCRVSIGTFESDCNPLNMTKA